MSDSRDTTTTSEDQPRRRDHLRLVTEPAEAGAVDPGALRPDTPRPRSIGRLIAQTAQLADSAVTRKRDQRETTEPRGGGVGGRLLRRLR